jgi:hypothetical protein
VPIAGSARKEANVWETMVAITGFSIGALLVCGAVFDFINMLRMVSKLERDNESTSKILEITVDHRKYNIDLESIEKEDTKEIDEVIQAVKSTRAVA